eukprot:TRINITY_DN28920_c0_g1_i1.p1 TRINITY_DN28920_c0_g1~~TRINITY_DN28920_c0_g1_i1.p1  ORF type:complete len:898 (+),score=118.61 TRINITY_DN28920_c0_g1_i1:51-2744(+)
MVRHAAVRKPLSGEETKCWRSICHEVHKAKSQSHLIRAFKDDCSCSCVHVKLQAPTRSLTKTCVTSGSSSPPKTPIFVPSPRQPSRRPALLPSSASARDGGANASSAEAAVADARPATTFCVIPAAKAAGRRTQLRQAFLRAARARRRGNVALHNACSWSSSRLIRRALEAPNFADVNARESTWSRTTPLMVACRSALEAKTADERLGGCVRLLLEHRAEVDAADRAGMTPLHFACLGGGIPVVLHLVAARADLALPDNAGRSAFMLACLSGDVCLAAWLLPALSTSLHVTEDVALALKDRAGFTALHHCCQNGSVMVARFLLSRGPRTLAECVTKTPQHASPLELAGMENHLELFALIGRHFPESFMGCNMEVLSPQVYQWMRSRTSFAANRELQESRRLAEYVACGRTTKVRYFLNSLASKAQRGEQVDASSVLNGHLLYLSHGVTPLLFSATSKGCSLSMVQLLVERRAEIPGRLDDRGRSVLHRLALMPEKASVDALEFLLKHLRSTNYSNKEHPSRTSDYATTVDANGESLLYLAARCKAPAVALRKVQIILSSFYFGREAISQRLWERAGGHGRLALHAAAELGNVDLIRWIMRRMLGADGFVWPSSMKLAPNHSLCDCRAWCGSTPLLQAARNHQHHSASVLQREFMADLFAEDFSGKGFVEYAREDVQDSSACEGMLRWWASATKTSQSKQIVDIALPALGPRADSEKRPSTAGALLPTLLHSLGRSPSSAQVQKPSEARRLSVSGRVGQMLRGRQTWNIFAAAASKANSAVRRASRRARGDLDPETDEETSPAVSPACLDEATSAQEAQRRRQRRSAFALWHCLGCGQQNLPSRLTCSLCACEATCADVADFDVVSSKNSVDKHAAIAAAEMAGGIGEEAPLPGPVRT